MMVTGTIDDVSRQLDQLGKPITIEIDADTSMLADAWSKMKELASEAWDSVEEEYKKFAEEANNNSKFLQDLGATTLDSLESGFSSFLSGGQVEWDELAKNMLEDLGKITAQMLAMKLVSSMLGGLFGGGVGVPTGGLGGTGWNGGGAILSAELPKFHTGGIVGLRNDEVPIIAQRGEGVFTPAQMAALGTKETKVNVNIVNNTNSSVSVEQRANGNGGVDIVAMIDEAMAGNAAKRTSKFNKAVSNRNALIRR